MKLHDILPSQVDKMNLLYDYIQGKPVNLSDEDRKLLERVNFADDQLRARKTDPVTIRLIMTKYGVSMSTARNDLVTAKYCFNTLSIHDKAYGLQLLLQINMAMLHRAEMEGNYKDANALMKTRIEILKQIDDTDTSVNRIQSSGNTYVLNVSLTGGRPRNYDLEKVHQLPEEQLELLNDRVHKMLPPDIVSVLKKRNDEQSTEAGT